MISKKISTELLNEIAELHAVSNHQMNKATMHLDRDSELLKQTKEELRFTLDNSKCDDNAAFIASLNEIEVNIQADIVFDSGMFKEIDMILNENNNLNQENILVRELESPEKIEVFSEVDDWSKMFNEARIYGEKNQIDLKNPYDNLFSAYANMEIRHKLIDELELSHLDKSDYAIAAGAGILAGIVDAVFVGTIGKGGDVSKLQGWTDDQYEKIVSTFASNASAADQINKLDKNKLGGKEYDEAKKRILKSVREKSHSTNVSYLEDRFKVLYDTTGGRNSKLASGGVVSGMNTGNHHILSLAHDPGPLGLVFSVIDQLTGKATFIENGKIIREATQNLNAINGEEVKGIIDAVHNWFGHCLSDVSGSSSSKYRGSGLPAPFYAIFQKFQFGSIPIDNKGATVTIAQLTEKMYREGYDCRAFTTQLIPVLIYEAINRIFWFLKKHFYLGNTVKESLPFGNDKDLQRMLFVSATSFTAIDIGHASVKSINMEPLTFFMTLNYPGLINFGFKSIQIIRNQTQHIQNMDRIDADIQSEWDRIILEG
nr:hypothetical protein [uncultured Acetobacterium sp.]